MYERLDEPGLTRIVNNAPYAGVRLAEKDRTIRREIERVVGEFQPDLVHVQHAMFLDTDFSCEVPLVFTLHDAWGWCAAGGQLLRMDQEQSGACEGPGGHCAGCASAWVKDGQAGEWLLNAAGRISPVFGTNPLHRAWSGIPAGWRAKLLAARAPVSAFQVGARSAQLRAFGQRFALLVSPSHYYANLAEKNGFPRVVVLPHGVNGVATAPRASGPLMFLGTIAPHKGALFVCEAHRLAGIERPLELWGPAGPDVEYVQKVAQTGCWHGAAANSTEVYARASAVVLGSVWPENAPLVILEARAAGRPVVAPRIGGIPEIVEHGVDGWLYEPGNAEDLGRCLRAVVESPPVQPSPPPTFDSHVEGLLGHYRALFPPRPAEAE
jgi:glycosyltransferase involved in cell wall biosynthesis